MAAAQTVHIYAGAARRRACAGRGGGWVDPARLTERGMQMYISRRRAAQELGWQRLPVVPGITEQVTQHVVGGRLPVRSVAEMAQVEGFTLHLRRGGNAGYLLSLGLELLDGALDTHSYRFHLAVLLPGGWVQAVPVIKGLSVAYHYAIWLKLQRGQFPIAELTEVLS